MDDRIQQQLAVLKSILEVGQLQIKTIENRLVPTFDTLSDTDNQISFLINEGNYFYLANFWQQYEFLVERIEIEKDLTRFQFYIPLARILIEHYSEFLYYVNQNRTNQLGIYTANYLLYLSDFYRFVAVGFVDIKNEYDRLLALWNSALVAEGIIYPDISLFSHKKIEKLGFHFPRYETIFKKEYFAQQSVDTFKLWKKYKPENFYDIYYRSYSLYTHPSFTNQMKVSTGTELFWIIQFLFIMGQLMIELGNKKVFNPPMQQEYDDITDKIAEAYPKLQEMWKEERK